MATTITRHVAVSTRPSDATSPTATSHRAAWSRDAVGGHEPVGVYGAGAGRSAGLVNAQRERLVDYCLTWARIDQGERALPRDGVVVPAARFRGNVRNPWTTVLNQYRAHFRALAGELGLTPASRIDRPRDADTDDDPFDTD